MRLPRRAARGPTRAAESTRVVIVRLLLFLALAAIGVALALWLGTHDRRYLRFVALTLKFTLVMLLAVLLGFAAERLLGPALGGLI